MPPKLLITRPRPSAERFAALVEDLCDFPVEPIFSPALLITTVPARVPPSLPGDLIFTSSHAVAWFSDRALDSSRNAWCVGTATATAASHAGFQVAYTAENAQQLVEAIKLSGKAEFLYLAGRHTTTDLTAVLADNNIECQTAVVYDQTVLPLETAAQAVLKGSGPVVLPVFSRRSAQILNGATINAPVHGVVISGAVAKVLEQHKLETVRIAKTPDEKAMLDATKDVLCGLSK